MAAVAPMQNKYTVRSAKVDAGSSSGADDSAGAASGVGASDAGADAGAVVGAVASAVADADIRSCDDVAAATAGGAGGAANGRRAGAVGARDAGVLCAGSGGGGASGVGVPTSMLGKLASGLISEAEYFQHVNTTSYNGSLKCAAVVDQVRYTKFDPVCTWSHVSMSAKASVTPEHTRKFVTRPE